MKTIISKMLTALAPKRIPPETYFFGVEPAPKGTPLSGPKPNASEIEFSEDYEKCCECGMPAMVVCRCLSGNEWSEWNPLTHELGEIIDGSDVDCATEEYYCRKCSGL